MSTKKAEPRKIFRDLPETSESRNPQINKFREAQLAKDRQYQKFVEKARELGADESEENFDRVLKKVVKAPPPKQESPKKKEG